MPRICWTPARLLEARASVKEHGNAAKAAVHLSKKWGRRITRSQVHCALRDAPPDEEIEKAEREYQRRMASDVEPLPSSFLMPGSTTWDRGEPDRQKKQEYNAKMGACRTGCTDSGPGTCPTGIATYISNLAEDERRFVNRRATRSIGVDRARPRDARDAAIPRPGRRFFKGRIQPSGYARKGRARPQAGRDAAPVGPPHRRQAPRVREPGGVRRHRGVAAPGVGRSPARPSSRPSTAITRRSIFC
jgi:hypothetical protein